jgi:hypothetical protein
MEKETNLKRIALWCLCGVILVCCDVFAGPILSPDAAMQLIEGEVITVDGKQYKASYTYDANFHSSHSEQALGFDYEVQEVVEIESKDKSYKYAVCCINSVEEEVHIILIVLE